MEPLDTLDQEVADLVGNSDIEKPENQGDPAINVDVLSASMGERSTLATHSSGENRHSLHRSGENLATLPTDNVTASLRSEYAKYSPVPSRYSPNLDRSSWGPHKTLPVQASDLSNHSTSYNSHGVVPAGSNQNDEDSQCATPSSSSMAGETQKGSPVFRGQRSKSDGKLFSPLMPDKNQSSKLSKRESLKVQKRHYRREKKRAAKELLHTLKDPSVIVMADWLKIRGTLKSWTKLWCVLKPGLLVLYKSQKQKSGHWVGTVLLNTCELIERPSKKDGFCFKLFHPLDQSIWATKGPKGENIGAITQPLPYSYLIFRALSEAAGKCWMDALELALRCSNLLMRTMTKDAKDTSVELEASIPEDTFLMSPLRQQMNDSDCERHFKGYGLEEDAKTDKEEEKEEKTESESEHSEEEEEKEVFDEDLQPLETPHIPNNEDFVLQGEASQTEEVAEENKSLIWALLKQVRPGMDLSKVVLPTFILEPRSFLDKLTDYYYHADLLSEAVAEEDPFSRMKGVVKWYLSGFYKKPKGPKKPYNPILGETFRCYWKHPKTGSRTFYIAEQISHHPPVSAFYVTNRQEGFSISGSILAKSKFYGNSLSAIMDGMGRLTFLKRGEDYLITIPYAHCKGVLIGTLIMELGGKVTIDCEKTGYSTELEFKLKPFLGGGEASNKITGKIKLGAETLAYIDGHWDGEVQLRDKITGESQMLWKACPEVRVKRLKRYTVALTHQADYESEKLWSHMTEALLKGDQDAATREKTVVEDEQRRMAKERKAKLEQWFPRYFERNSLTGDWLYKYADLRPWDPMNDLIHYEQDYVIQTKTRHRTPIVRTTSITNVDDPATRAQQRQSSMERARATRIKRAKHLRPTQRESGSSTPDAENRLLGDSESSDSMMGNESRHGRSSRLELAIVEKALEPLIRIQQHNTDTLGTIQNQLTFLARHTAMQENAAFFTNKDFFMIAMVLLIQTVFFWFLK